MPRYTPSYNTYTWTAHPPTTSPPDWAAVLLNVPQRINGDADNVAKANRLFRNKLIRMAGIVGIVREVRSQNHCVELQLDTGNYYMMSDVETHEGVTWNSD